MPVKLEMLRSFAEVVEHGGLNNAGQALGRSASALSMTLKQLEAEVGAPLFETGRKTRPTRLGTLIYQEARREIDSFENTRRMIEACAHAREGTVRVAATPSVASTIMPDVIREFHATHPDVGIELRDMESIAVERDVVEDRVDFGLSSMRAAKGVESHPLFTDSFGVVCHRDNPLAAKGDPVTWARIAEEPFLAHRLCRLIDAPDFGPIRAAARLTLPGIPSVLALVRDNVGITLLPRRAIDTDGTPLSFLPFATAPPRRNVHLLTRRGRHPLPAAAALMSAVREHAGQDADVQDFRD